MPETTTSPAVERAAAVVACFREQVPLTTVGCVQAREAAQHVLDKLTRAELAAIATELGADPTGSFRAPLWARIKLAAEHQVRRGIAAAAHVPSAPDPDVLAPAVGDLVIPHAGLVWCGRPVPVEPHEVVAMHDYRPALGECVVVVQSAHELRQLRPQGHPANPEHGAYLGLVDVTPVAGAERQRIVARVIREREPAATVQEVQEVFRRLTFGGAELGWIDVTVAGHADDGSWNWLITLPAEAAAQREVVGRYARGNDYLGIFELED